MCKNCKTFENLLKPAKLEFRHHICADDPTNQREDSKEKAMKWEGKKLTPVNNLLYVNDGASAFSTKHSTKQDLENGVKQLHNPLAKFGLQMHDGSENAKSKTKAMYVPPSIEEAQANEDVPQSITMSQGENDIHFMRKFRYLGSIIAADLTKDAGIKIRVKKAWTQMFFYF